MEVLEVGATVFSPGSGGPLPGASGSSCKRAVRPPDNIPLPLLTARTSSTGSSSICAWSTHAPISRAPETRSKQRRRPSSNTFAASSTCNPASAFSMPAGGGELSYCMPPSGTARSPRCTLSLRQPEWAAEAVARFGLSSPSIIECGYRDIHGRILRRHQQHTPALAHRLDHAASVLARLRRTGGMKSIEAPLSTASITSSHNCATSRSAWSEVMEAMVMRAAVLRHARVAAKHFPAIAW